MRSLIIFVILIVIPAIGGAIPAYFYGYKRGATMVLDRLEPLFRRTSFRLADHAKRQRGDEE